MVWLVVVVVVVEYTKCSISVFFPFFLSLLLRFPFFAASLYVQLNRKLGQIYRTHTRKETNTEQNSEPHSQLTHHLPIALCAAFPLRRCCCLAVATSTTDTSETTDTSGTSDTTAVDAIFVAAAITLGRTKFSP